MKLVTFDVNGAEGVGLVRGQSVIQLATLGFDVSMADLIDRGDAFMKEIERRATHAAGVPMTEVRLLAPLPRPRRGVFCAGKNYADHAAEYGMSGYDKVVSSELPKYPVLFFKLPSSVIGPEDPIPSHPAATQELDYEAELAVVIGKKGRSIPAEKAMEHVFGYTLINDVTARDWQKGHDQWAIGKSFDGFCPMGPAIVTRDEIDDLSRLEYRCYVNGEQRQWGRPQNLLFGIPALINMISAGIELQPGDIIATGSPTGVGIGFKPPRFLKPNDVVCIKNDLIGTIENRVI